MSDLGDAQGFRPGAGRAVTASQCSSTDSVRSQTQAAAALNKHFGYLSEHVTCSEPCVHGVTHGVMMVQVFLEQSVIFHSLLGSEVSLVFVLRVGKELILSVLHKKHHLLIKQDLKL